MPNLPFGISVIDAIIVAVFVFQILWGAKLGFALATFALAGEILGLVAAVIYSPGIATFLDNQFHLANQINVFLAGKINIPAPQIEQFKLGQTIFEAIVFLLIYILVQSSFFYLGRFIHHQVGVRRMTYFSNSFFGMIIGLIKATLEVTFALIAWNMVTSDGNVHAALQTIGTFTQFGTDSKLLPIFQTLVPAASPFAKFF